ncbi:MAG: sortase [Chloroflexi bacterium]|nr:sortase [Chloroflexota bacterium]
MSIIFIPAGAGLAAVCTDPFTVTTTADSGAGSLRDGITSANGVCNNGTILFDASLNGQTISLTTGEILIAKNLTITGPGMNSLTISAGASSRIFNITSTTVSISGLTFANGQSGAANGGAILSAGGELTISASRFRNNTGASGGAIEINSSSPLTVTDSIFDSNLASSTDYGGGAIRSNNGNIAVARTSFTGNTAYGNGGGAIATTVDFGAPGITVTDSSFTNNRAENFDGGAINGSGDLTVAKSTFNDNFAIGNGGAINLINGSGNFTNVTITGNSANGEGGGIYVRDRDDINGIITTINFSTISNNTADFDNDGSGDGGGVSGGGVGSPDVSNSIIAGNTDRGGESPNCFDITSQDYNLIGNTTGCTIAGTTTNNLNNVSPQLTGLANNGGPTQTQALASTSPAVNTANPSCTSTDQRGAARPGGTRCDMGAYELIATLSIVGGNNQTANINQAFTNSLLVQASDPFGNPVGNLSITYLSPASGASANLTAGIAEHRGNGKLASPLSARNFATVNVTTNAAGRAAANATANGQTGTYAVTATAQTVNSAVTFTLTNTAAPPTATATAAITATATITATAPATTTATITPTGVPSTDEDPSGPGSRLPASGFPSGKVSILPVQPADKQYFDLSASGELVLEIPLLKVKTTITGVPLVKNEWDVKWLGQQAGWLQGSAFPTWKGNSAIAGHVFDSNGNSGPFVNLSKLRWGDKVIIHAWGEKYTYEVRSVRGWVSPTDKSVLKHEDKAWLTLITCRGYNEKTNSYRWRSVIRAVLISITADK